MTSRSNWSTIKDTQRKRYKDKVKEVIDTARVTTPCYFCGEMDPIIKQFHHIYPEEKLFDIGHSHSSRGIAAVQAEIAKCIVVCANDHLRIHAGVFELDESGAYRRRE